MSFKLLKLSANMTPAEGLAVEYLGKYGRILQEMPVQDNLLGFYVFQRDAATSCYNLADENETPLSVVGEPVFDESGIGVVCDNNNYFDGTLMSQQYMTLIGVGSVPIWPTNNAYNAGFISNWNNGSPSGDDLAISGGQGYPTVRAVAGRTATGAQTSYADLTGQTVAEPLLAAAVIEGSNNLTKSTPYFMAGGGDLVAGASSSTANARTPINVTRPLQIGRQLYQGASGKIRVNIAAIYAASDPAAALDSSAMADTAEYLREYSVNLGLTF